MYLILSIYLYNTWLRLSETLFILSLIQIVVFQLVELVVSRVSRVSGRVEEYYYYNYRKLYWDYRSWDARAVTWRRVVSIDNYNYKILVKLSVSVFACTPPTSPPPFKQSYRDILIARKKPLRGENLMKCQKWFITFQPTIMKTLLDYPCSRSSVECLSYFEIAFIRGNILVLHSPHFKDHLTKECWMR